MRPSGADSLTGSHTFDRFNPAVGVTYSPAGSVNVYFSYSEGSRAPTSVELGCANPDQPCKLPNAMAGDPPLAQVVAKTFEAGVRSGSESKLGWSAGWFRAQNSNDILFVASTQTGFGYFKNFGQTRRQGFEADLHGRIQPAEPGRRIYLPGRDVPKRRDIGWRGQQQQQPRCRRIERLRRGTSRSLPATACRSRRAIC